MTKPRAGILAAALCAWSLLLPGTGQADTYYVNNGLCSECDDQDADWRRYRNMAIQQCLSVPAQVPAYQVFGVDPEDIQSCRQMIAYQLVHGLSDRVVIEICPRGDRVPAERRHLCVTMQIQIEWETFSVGVDLEFFGFTVNFPRRPDEVFVISRSPNGDFYHSGYPINFPDGQLEILGGWPPTDPDLLPYPGEVDDTGDSDDGEDGDDAGDDDGPSGEGSDPPGPPDDDDDGDDDDDDDDYHREL